MRQNTMNVYVSAENKYNYDLNGGRECWKLGHFSVLQMQIPQAMVRKCFSKIHPCVRYFVNVSVKICLKL